MFLYMKLFICNLEIILIINVLTAQRKEETGRYVYIDGNGIRQYCHYCNRTGLGLNDQDRYVEQKCVEKNYPFEDKTDEEEQRNQWRPVCTNGTIPSCPELKKESNGAWNCSSEQNETDIYFSETEGTYILPVYTECTLTCNNNFHVTYTNSTYCNESRQWDADPGSIHCVKVTDLNRNQEGSPFLIVLLVSAIVMIIICCGLVCLFSRRRRKLYSPASRSWIAIGYDERYQTQTHRKLDGMDMPECIVKTITSTTMTEKDKTGIQDGGEANMVVKVVPYTGQIEKCTNYSQLVPDAIATENEGNNCIQEKTCAQRMEKDTVTEQSIELENYSLNTPFRNTVSLDIESAENTAKEAKKTFAYGTEDESELRNADSDSGVYDKANDYTNIKNEKKWRNDTPLCQGIDVEMVTGYTCLEKQRIEDKVNMEKGNDKLMEIKLQNKEEMPHIAEYRERRVSSDQSAVVKMKTAIRLTTFDNNDYYGIATVEQTPSLVEGDDSISLENCKSIENLHRKKLFGDKDERYQTQTHRKLDGFDNLECMVKTITSTTMTEKDKTSFQEGGQPNMVYKCILHAGQIEKNANYSQFVPAAIATENEGNNCTQERTCSQRMDKDTVVEHCVELENYPLNTPFRNTVLLDIGSAENIAKEEKRTSANGTEDESKLRDADSDNGAYDKANDYTKIVNEKCRNDTSLGQVTDIEMVTGYKCLEKQRIEEKVTMETSNDKLMEIKLQEKEEMPHCAEYRERRASSTQSAESEMKNAIGLTSFDSNKYYGIVIVERKLSLAQVDDSISLENCKSIEGLHRQKLFGDKDERDQTPTHRELDGMDMPECMVKTITSTNMKEKDKTSFQEGGQPNMVYKVILHAGQIEKNANYSQFVSAAIATENEGNNCIQERTCSQRMDKDTLVEQGVELENYPLNTPFRNTVSLDIGSAENIAKEEKRISANGTEDESKLRDADSDNGAYDKANDYTKIVNEMCTNDTPLGQVIDVEMVTGYKCLEKQRIEEKVTMETSNDKLMEIKLQEKEEMPHCAEYRERRASSTQSAETEMKTAIGLQSFDSNKYYGIATVERKPSLAQVDDSISLENCKSIEGLHRQKLFGDKEHIPSDKLAPGYDVVEHLINCGDNISLQQFLDDVGREDEEKVLNCLKCSLSLHDCVENQNKTKTILSWICDELTKLHNPHKVEVWPATLVEKDSDQSFPILICNYWEDIIETYRGKHFYGMTVKYQEYDSVNKEEVFLRASKEFLESTLSKTQAKEANAIVSKNTDMLMENYRNLEMIKPCHVRSVHFQSEDIKKKGKWEVIQEPTIVLYCRMKGYIPFGEKLFPKRLGDGPRSLPVDVREGFFVGAMMKGSSTFSEAGENWNTSTVSAEEEWDPSLFRMGVSMGPLEKIVQGTVGPFVHLDDNAIGFLTCAHVFGIPSTISNVKGKEVVHPANGEYVSVHGTDNDDVCGHIDRIVFDVNPDHPVSVDAAIVKIKAGKTPHRGRFARMDARDLSEADIDWGKCKRKKGLQPGQCLKFDNGEILKKETIEKEELKQGKFIKFGSKSGVTSSNHLGHEHIVVRVRQDAALDHDDGELSPPIIGGSRAYLMKGQYVINSKSRIPFLVPGDSGCGVFHMDEHKRLRCVGIGIGSMSFGQEAVVTPIEDILRALDLGEDSLMKFVSTPPDVLENTHL